MLTRQLCRWDALESVGEWGSAHDDLGEKYERSGSNHQSLMVESCEQLQSRERERARKKRNTGKPRYVKFLVQNKHSVE